MNVMRVVAVFILAGVLSACGPDEEPSKPSSSDSVSALKQVPADQEASSPSVPKAKPPSDTGAATGKIQAVEPQKATQDTSTPAKQEKAVKLDLQLELEQAAKLETNFEAKLEPEPVEYAPVKIAPAAKAVVKAAKLKLDLSLPRDLVKQLNEADTAEYRADPALPPMFGPKEIQPKPFELSGKLITDDTKEGDALDSISGAQLQFEFKQ